MRAGFTLIELVIVVLILGILAAVTVPRIVDAVDDTKEASLVNTLYEVRTAIDMHRQKVGSYPGNASTEVDFKSDLQPFLRRFAKNPIKDSDQVAVKTDGLPFTGTVAGGAGWRYDNQSGQFIANSNGMSSDGVRRYWEL
jgi:general secretion pathway protein G